MIETLEEIWDLIDDRGLDYWIHGMICARSLEGVQVILNDVPEKYADAVIGEMKTFGEEPKDLDGVWSWDDDRILVGEMRNTKIVDLA